MATSARLDELKKKFDENPRRYFAPLANEYRKQGDLPQAIALCRAHLPNQPGHISGHVVLGQSLYEARELAASREAFEAALDLDPENLIALRHLGDIAREQGDGDQARTWYQRVLEADPRNDEITQLLKAVESVESAYSAGGEVIPQSSPLDEVSLDTAAAEPVVSPTAWIPASPIATVHDVTPEPVEIMDDFPAPEVIEATASEATASEATAIEATASEAAQSEATASEPAVSEAAMTEAAISEPEPVLHMDAAEDAVLTGTASPALEASVDEFPSAEILGELEAVAEPIPDDWFTPSAQLPGLEGDANDVAPLPTFDDALFTSLGEPTPAASPEVGATAGELSEIDGEAAEEPTPPFVAPVAESLANAPTPPFLPVVGAPEPQSDWDAAPESLLELPEVAGAGAEQEVLPEGFVVEYSEFVPPELDETPFIANTVSVPLDEGDPFSVGAPELSAHEPFSIESSFGEQPPLPPSISPPEGEEAPEPIEGLLSRETFETDAAMVAGVEEGGADEAAVEWAAVDEAEATPFVTETMAELYLQQGFVDEALGIYRQLLDQHPEDVALRDRVSAIERGASSAVVAGVAPRDVVDRHGQSVRSFFAHFARREPHRRAERSANDGDAEASHGGRIVAATVASEYAGAATRDEALTVPDEAAPGRSLTQLFATGDVSRADEEAATTLASAFEAGDGAPPRSGRSAERELSLEHLFRDVPARSSGAVTLDEFYHGSSPAGSDPAAQGTEGGEERDTDIEQFTAWLEGLKKK